MNSREKREYKVQGQYDQARKNEDEEDKFENVGFEKLTSNV